MLLARLMTSLEQDTGVDCIDMMIQLLERDTMTSSMTSRTDVVSQLTRCVFTACTDFEQQLQVRFSLLTAVGNVVSATTTVF